MFSRLGIIFTLAPIFRGFIAMLVCGASFPLCGVMVLRLDLIPMRYMLMHGVILGGAISLALNLPVIPVSVIINILLIFLMLSFTKSQSFGFSGASAATMVLSMALASIIMHVADVPAKDTLSMMWGSPYALTKNDLITLAVLALILISYLVFNFKNILALFYNREIAVSLGVRVKFHYTFMVLIIALIVALAMKLLGAFLIDSLLILPVLTGSCLCGRKSAGMKKLFIFSSIVGFIFSIVGYCLAVMLNWPPAATISMVAGAGYMLSLLFRIGGK